MRSIQTSATLIVFNIMVLMACSYDLQESKDIKNYDLLLQENSDLSNKVTALELKLSELKENAAYLIALKPVDQYFTEEELFKLIEEIPKGNPFETDFLVTASFGESTGFFPRNDHGGMDAIPIHPENMKWDIKPIGDGKVVHDGDDIIHGKNVIVEHTPRVRTRYSHLSKYFYDALTGEDVITETVLGRMGSTGYSKNAHLHLELWIKVNDILWIKIDPRAFVRRA
jgi:murein DD-endopeptidase MepM/ murein hydrolase activator NlpD